MENIMQVQEVQKSGNGLAVQQKQDGKIRVWTEYDLADAQEMADTIVRGKPGLDGRWNSLCTLLLTGILLHLSYENTESTDLCADAMNYFGADWDDYRQILLRMMHSELDPDLRMGWTASSSAMKPTKSHPVLGQICRIFLRVSENELGSVMAICYQRLMTHRAVTVS